MAHFRDPGEAHHAFIRALDTASKQFEHTLSPAERLAIAAQFVGQLIGEMPDQYDKREIMDVTARNLQAGNDHATGGTGSPLLLGGG
jgi:hypothetical protein